MESISHSKASAERSYTYRIDLNYIGTSFSGWQSQPSGNTVQDHLEKALTVALRQKIRIAGASRTDAGVHAEHQVATFRLDHEIDCPRVLRSLEAMIPRTIGLTKLARSADDFHPISSAHSKLYRYRFWLGQGSNAFVRPFAWAIPHPLDIESMKRASQLFLGRHNFKSFAAVDGSSKTFDRTILDLRWVHQGENLLELYILGEGFLKQMVRNLVGTLIEVGQSKRAAEDMLKIIAAEDRTKAGMAAPAAGLSLVEIYYDECDRIPERHLNRAAAFSFAFSSPLAE